MSDNKKRKLESGEVIPGQTAAGQVAELRELAARLSLEVAHVYQLDEEQAGSVWRGEPPQKAEVLALARLRKFDVLLVWSLDRWARRRRDGVRDVFEVFGRLGITVVSVQEPWLSTEQIPEAFREALAHLVLWLAEEESTRKSERIKLLYRTKRNRAAGGGGRARWGRGRIPTPAEAAQVRQLRTEGLSIRAIASRLSLPKSTVGDLLSEGSGGEAAPAPSED